MAAPTHYRVQRRLQGPGRARRHPARRRGAARSSRPRRRSTRMRLGRIDAETTANVGHDRGRDRDERRSRALQGRGGGAKPRRPQGQRRRVASWSTCSRGPQALRRRTWTRRSRSSSAHTAYPSPTRPSWSPDARCRDCGVEPALGTTGGGSDANAFQARGFACLNMANGTEANHTPDESRQRAGAREDARRRHCGCSCARPSSDGAGLAQAMLKLRRGSVVAVDQDGERLARLSGRARGRGRAAPGHRLPGAHGAGRRRATR